MEVKLDLSILQSRPNFMETNGFFVIVQMLQKQVVYGLGHKFYCMYIEHGS